MRRAILYPLFSILFLLPGCVKDTAPVAQVDKSPLIVDEAMQHRNWSRTVVRFQNGETPSWATGFILEHPKDEPKLLPVLTDGPMFLENVVLLPIDYVLTPPWERVIYPQGVVEPSFTGIPPLPPKE